MFYVFAIWVMASNVLKGEKGPTVEGPTKKEKEKRSRREKKQEKKEKLAMKKKAKKAKKEKGKGKGMGKGGMNSSKVAPEEKTNTDDNIGQSNGINADVSSIDGNGGDGGDGGGDGGVSDGVSGGDYSLVTPREAEFRRLELHRIFALLQEKKAKQLLATMMEGSLQVSNMVLSLLQKLHARTHHPSMTTIHDGIVGRPRRPRLPHMNVRPSTR